MYPASDSYRVEFYRVLDVAAALQDVSSGMWSLLSFFDQVETVVTPSRCSCVLSPNISFQHHDPNLPHQRFSVHVCKDRLP